MPSRHVGSQRVTAWKSSGLSASAFAALHGFDPRSLYFWSSSLRRSPASSSDIRFAQVVASEPTSPAAPLDIWLSSGRVVRVRPGFDPVLLRAVVEALEAP